MSTGPGRRLALLLAAAAAGCGSSGGNGYSLDVGADDGGTSPGFGLGGDAAVSDLQAHIEQNHMTVTFVTVSCAGPCADVVAVAAGGQPPYAFRWEDGSTSASRHVCPSASTRYAVTVTDTGTTGELAQGAQSVQVPLAADVLACPDGGGAGDGGARGCASAADAFDVAASFVPTGSNPAGAWSYGYSATLGATFVRYPDFLPATGASDAGGGGWVGVVQWMDLSLGTYSGPVPDVVFNAGSTAQHPPSGIGSSWTLQPGQLALWPGSPGNEYSIARWTAPSAGIYVVQAAFLGIDGDSGLPQSTTDVHVQHDATDVPGGSGFINLNGAGNAFSVVTEVVVAPGDTIDFAVGPGDGLHTYDATALDARICKAAGDGG
jgi:hypothetical protein